MVFNFIFIFSKAQIKIFIFEDVPPIQAELILNELYVNIPKYLPDSVKIYQIIPLPKKSLCIKNNTYNVDDYFKSIDTCSRRCVGITYRNISYNCNFQYLLDGFTYDNHSIATIYNVGYIQRLVKIVLHELGHTYGLEHCKSKGCFMEKGGMDNQLDAYDKEYHFCTFCNLKLKYYAKNKIKK